MSIIPGFYIIKPKVIYEYIDKLIMLFPDFDYFLINEYYIQLEPDFKERKKLYSLASEIRTVMVKLGYTEVPPNRNTVHVLTEKGRLVKSKGGHFKYLKSLEPKKDWFKMIPIILSIVFGISMAVIGFLNYKLNKDKDSSNIEKERLNKQVDSLKEKIKILENKEI
ncbi:hypothetical protein [Chryseobacterium indoltheticum]|uniref:hypothetical protein n=1 Tax=Chryseobacterium indoltheticum TaxID=254 RepID=UPI001914C2E1|nr:hypothetical protein [Chryseobacterium indoltheticum]QQQ28674.1 hypothetical protein JJL46_01285 [Chryseobacterium indoltheticum]